MCHVPLSVRCVGGGWEVGVGERGSICYMYSCLFQEMWGGGGWDRCSSVDVVRVACVVFAVSPLTARRS